MKFALSILCFFAGISGALGLSFNTKNFEPTPLRALSGEDTSRVKSYIEGRNFDLDFKFPIGEITAWGKYRNFLILATDAGMYGSVTFIIDTKSGIVADVIRHYFLSENQIVQTFGGRFLLFRKFYPRFCPPQMRTDFLMVYDLEKLEAFVNSAKFRQADHQKSLCFARVNCGEYFYPPLKLREGEIALSEDSLSLDISGCNVVDGRSGEYVLSVSKNSGASGRGFLLEEFLVVQERILGTGECALNLKKVPLSLCKFYKDGKLKTGQISSVRKFHLGNVEFFKDSISIENGGCCEIFSKVVIERNCIR